MTHTKKFINELPQQLLLHLVFIKENDSIQKKVSKEGLLMTREIQHFIECNYNIGASFYSHMIYRVFLATGMSRSQISACLNNVKKKGVITNQTTNGYGARFNHQTGRRPPKVWVRLK